MARPPQTYEHDDIEDSAAGWAERLGIPVSAFRARLKRGLEGAELFAPSGEAPSEEDDKPRKKARVLRGGASSSASTTNDESPPELAPPSQVLAALGYEVMELRTPKGILFFVES